MGRLIETSAERLGGVDVAFFNVGIRFRPGTEFSAEDWDEVVPGQPVAASWV